MRLIVAGVRLSAIAALALVGGAYSESVSETTSVQIVNATSVPVISLKINDNLAYDAFPQGKKSADAPVRVLEAVYEAEDKQTGTQAKSQRVAYEPGAHQSLIILGDFSTPAPAPEQPGTAPEENRLAPNVLFKVFSHAATRPPVRLRIVNGIPGKSLTFAGGNTEIVIKPGDHAVLESQPPVAQYTASVDGVSIPLLMRQEGLIRNAMIVFYLKDGNPAFTRAFENNADSNRARADMEKARN
jgi:hypothetical protein